MTRRYPLEWPAGWPRTDPAGRMPAKFGVMKQSEHGWSSRGAISVHAAIRRLQDQLDRLRASDPTLSTNLPLRLDGQPLSNVREPDDPGVALYFTRKGKPIAMACDRWTRTADNIAAIAAHIDALRRIERYGVGSLDRAFHGYRALAAPGAASARPWREVLMIADDGQWIESLPAGELIRAEQAYRRLAKRRHPDNGGTADAMAELNAAIAEARKELAQP